MILALEIERLAVIFEGGLGGEMKFGQFIIRRLDKQLWSHGIRPIHAVVKGV